MACKVTGWDKETILDLPYPVLNMLEHAELYSKGVKLAGVSDHKKVADKMIALKMKLCPPH